MTSARHYEQVGTERYTLMPDPAGVLWFIQKYGIFGLGGADGCYCCSFALRGIEVSVSCHKSEHCVRVVCHCLRPKDLFAIAREVLSQLPDGGISYRVRFCEYAADHVDGHWSGRTWVETYKCCYCGKPRDDVDGYLCTTCRTNPDAQGYDVPVFTREGTL